MLHSEINHVADFLRSLVEARSACLPFLDWKPQVYPQHPQAVAMQPQMMMYTPPPSNHGNFDPSARFGKGASYNIPPPPPGVMPTGAQVAAMQGQAVHMTHQKKGWFEGASDGGATLW